MALSDWWEKHGAPRLIKFSCGAEPLMQLREQVVPLARGEVFEIGCGGGINQRFYEPAVITRYAGIDPSGKLLDYARTEAERRGWGADIRQGVGEAIPFPDDSFDTVVCTYTMCSVVDQAQVVRELRRILRPGGRLLFLEHGRAPDPEVARWQDRIEPWWKPVMGGCRLTRPVTSAIAAGGFTVEPLGQRYLPRMPRAFAWMEWGVGVKTGS